MRTQRPRLHVNGTTLLKTSCVRPPAAWRAAAPGQGCSGDEGVLALVPWPGKAAMGLERRVVGQGLVATPGRGGKVVTAILSATYNLRLYGPNSVFKGLEGRRIPHIPELPANGGAHGGQGS